MDHFRRWLIRAFDGICFEYLLHDVSASEPNGNPFPSQPSCAPPVLRSLHFPQIQILKFETVFIFSSSIIRCDPLVTRVCSRYPDIRGTLLLCSPPPPLSLSLANSNRWIHPVRIFVSILPQFYNYPFASFRTTKAWQPAPSSDGSGQGAGWAEHAGRPFY